MTPKRLTIIKDEIVLIIGKLLYGALFFMSGIGHFKDWDSVVGYARAKNVFMADLMVMISGAVLVVAPILLVLGFLETLALLAIIGFLLGTMITVHAFWKTESPMERYTERVSFMKNLSLLGAAVALIATL